VSEFQLLTTCLHIILLYCVDYVQETPATGIPRDSRVISRLLELAKEDVQQAHSCVPRDDTIAALMQEIVSELEAQRPLSAAAVTVLQVSAVLVFVMMLAHSVGAV
jgi:hypothetical protein